MRKSSALKTPRGTREPCDLCGGHNAPTFYGENLHTLRARLLKFSTPDWIVSSGYAHQRCYKTTVSQIETLEGKPKPPTKRGRCVVCAGWGGGWEPDLIKNQKRVLAGLLGAPSGVEDGDFIHTRCSKLLDERIADLRRKHPARPKSQP